LSINNSYTGESLEVKTDVSIGDTANLRSEKKVIKQLAGRVEKGRNVRTRTAAHHTESPEEEKSAI